MKKKMPFYLQEFLAENSSNEVRETMSHTAELKAGAVYIECRYNRANLVIDLMDAPWKYPELYELLKRWASEDLDVMAIMVEAEL